MQRRIILDVDTGSDDAIAVMAAILSPEIQVEGICTVAGNKDLDKTTENTLRLVQFLGVDIPVYRGCARPLVKHLYPDRYPRDWPPKKLMVKGKEVQVHSDYLDLPPATICEERIRAVEFYVQYLRNAVEPVTIVAVAPLTNLAAALLVDATIVKNIREIVIMGGGYRITNCPPAAEFNIWYDPEAAKCVLSCGAKITMVPLDATHQTYVTAADCRRMRASNSPYGAFAASICEQRIEVQSVTQPLESKNTATVHDAVCIGYIVNPEILQDVRSTYVDIGLRNFCDGQTILAFSDASKPANCNFAYSGNRKHFSDFLCNLFEEDASVRTDEYR